MSASRLAKGRNRSRYGGNLHVINTKGMLAAFTQPPDHIRTVTMIPKKNVQIPEPQHKVPVATKILPGQKGAAMSFRKKKINAAKNFLKHHNKESPVKKACNPNVNPADDYSKPSLSSNDPPSNSTNSDPLPIASNNDMTSNSPDGNTTSNLSNNPKTSKYVPVTISHQSHSCLALYEVDMTLKARNASKAQTNPRAKNASKMQTTPSVNNASKTQSTPSVNNESKTQTTPSKEKKDVVVQKDDSGSSWVTIDMKKGNATKDFDKIKNPDKGKNSPSRNLEENQNRPVFDKNISKGKKPMTDIPSKMFADSKDEKMPIHQYPGSSMHFSSRKEEQYYEKIYGLSRSSMRQKTRNYKRKQKQQYKDSYPYYFSQKSVKERRKSFHEDLEALEDVSDVPLDEDFEEVETASMEDQSKPSEIPVGFRKYKIRYLASKRIGFFKPKRYHVCQDRTVVSCLNMEEESVDVVSEAEYETDQTAAEKDTKKADGGKLIADDSGMETTSKTAESKVLETTDESVKMEQSVDIPKITDEQLEGKGEPSKPVPDSDADMSQQTDEISNSAAIVTNLTETSHNIPSIKEKRETVSSSKFYYACIPESDFPDFYQGHSLFQKHLDEWESHLIGLEYIVEIRDAEKTEAKKYHCGLCMEQLTGVNNGGQIITNHVSSYKHTSTYMAKHFPSCDYKFYENEISCSVLQKCCKEINKKLSCNFLCVTTDDYFQKHEKEVQELLDNLPHWSETDIDIDVNSYVEDVDRDVSQLMKDMIHEVAPGEEIATFITSRNESPQELHRIKVRNSILEKESPSIDNSGQSVSNLIVLTPIHSRSPKSIPKCITPISKCSSDIRPNLLRVNTHEETLNPIDKSNKTIILSTELSDQSSKDTPVKTVPSPVESEVLNFKSINKKAVSYRKYRAKQTSDKTNIEPKGNEIKETGGVRTVRKIIKNSGEITVCLEPKNIDENANMGNFEEAEAENSPFSEEIVDELSNESGIQVLEDSTVGSNFSDSLGGSNVISGSETAESSRHKYKAKHHSHHRATAHSKHCIKRILSKSSKSTKEFSFKKESSDFDVIQLDSKSNGSTESELDRKFKDLSPVDSKASSGSRKITSPIRAHYSPVYSSDLSRVSARRRSRSPLRRRSRSPIRRRHSPFRRSSRSPIRRRSRSPRRHSRSPVRRRSRSPKKRSRSPVRRSSRSPIRRRSRSPVRRRSKSPLRRRSRSPIRRRSRSPIRHRSRSPVRKRSRSPVGRRSRSPRTSSRRKSRSPIRSRHTQKISISPSRRPYISEAFAPLSKHSSPLRKRYESDDGSLKSDSRSSFYGDSGSKLGSHKEYTASSQSRYPQRTLHESERDLDPISDEEEPAYFNTDGLRHLEEIKKLPEPTRSMVMQLLQKFSASKVTPKDPSFSELMQFVNSHNSEVSKPYAPVNQEGASMMRNSGSALQRFLLSNLSETSGHQNLPPNHALQHAMPSFHSSGVSFSPSRPDLPPVTFSQQFSPPNVQQHGPLHHPGPTPIPQVQLPPFDNQSVHTQFHPPQYDSFRPQNEPPSFQPHNKPPSFQPQHKPPSFQPQHESPSFRPQQEPPSFQPQHEPPSFRPQQEPPNFQPKVRSDGMFKDLKAAVSKLFGANEGNSNDRPQPPPSREFMAEQSQSQWGQDRNTFNQFDSFGPKNVINNNRDDSNFRNQPRGGIEPPSHSLNYQNKPAPAPFYSEEQNLNRLNVPPPDAKVSFCDAPQAPVQKNLFPVVNSPKAVNEVKVSLAQRLAAVLVKVGMLDVSGALLQEMLMKIGAFSACPPQDISEENIIDILRRLGYLNRY